VSSAMQHLSHFFLLAFEETETVSTEMLHVLQVATIWWMQDMRWTLATWLHSKIQGTISTILGV